MQNSIDTATYYQAIANQLGVVIGVPPVAGLIETHSGYTTLGFYYSAPNPNGAQDYLCYVPSLGQLQFSISVSPTTTLLSPVTNPIHSVHSPLKELLNYYEIVIENI